jgi:hypothetical protein
MFRRRLLRADSVNRSLGLVRGMRADNDITTTDVAIMLWGRLGHSGKRMSSSRCSCFIVAKLVFVA